MKKPYLLPVCNQEDCKPSQEGRGGRKRAGEWYRSTNNEIGVEPPSCGIIVWPKIKTQSHLAAAYL